MMFDFWDNHYSETSSPENETITKNYTETIHALSPTYYLIKLKELVCEVDMQIEFFK